MRYDMRKEMMDLINTMFGDYPVQEKPQEPMKKRLVVSFNGEKLYDSDNEEPKPRAECKRNLSEPSAKNKETYVRKKLANTQKRVHELEKKVSEMDEVLRALAWDAKERNKGTAFVSIDTDSPDEDERKGIFYKMYDKPKLFDVTPDTIIISFGDDKHIGLKYEDAKSLFSAVSLGIRTMNRMSKVETDDETKETED